MGIGRPLATSNKGTISGDVVTKTTSDMTLYVRTDGDDSNNGLTESTALATIQEAIDRVPSFICHPVLIDVGQGTFDGFEVMYKNATPSNYFTIQGTLTTPTLTTGTTSGTVTGGDSYTIVDTNQSWTTDELKGLLVEIDGETRFIQGNTSTQLDLVGALSSDPVGKVYSILKHGTIVSDTSKPFDGGIIIVRNCGTYIELKNLHIDMTQTPLAGVLPSYTNYVKLQTIKLTGEAIAPAWCGRISYRLFAYDIYSIANSTSGWSVEFAYTFAVDAKRIYVENGSSFGFAAVQVESGIYTDMYGFNNGNGIYIGYHSYANFYGQVKAQNNTNDGLMIYATNYTNLDKGDFSNNNNYGIRIGKYARNDFVTGTTLNAGGTLTVSGNGKSGIFVTGKSLLGLADCAGSDNGEFGIEATGNSTVIISSGTSLTGGSGDITIDDGDSTLSYSSDFAADGDIVSNLTNGCRVERKD